MRKLIILFFVLASCSYIPEPLNDPEISSFGKKCNEETWSYIWIYKKGQNLTASEKACKIPIKSDL
tara:strand:+ start:915 stop:1112 length:198 start_codon:yes stop_codon:yes gene_type:complete